jgi:hypothetical protein
MLTPLCFAPACAHFDSVVVGACVRTCLLCFKTCTPPTPLGLPTSFKLNCSCAVGTALTPLGCPPPLRPPLQRRSPTHSAHIRACLRWRSTTHSAWNACKCSIGTAHTAFDNVFILWFTHALCSLAIILQTLESAKGIGFTHRRRAPKAAARWYVRRAPCMRPSIDFH